MTPACMSKYNALEKLLSHETLGLGSHGALAHGLWDKEIQGSNLRQAHY